MPKLKFIKMIGSWREVADACRTTIGKDAGKGEPSDKWKNTILKCEHSPIRKLKFNWKWEDLPYWVSVHFVRHKFGIEHWVSTQRTDRTGSDRSNKSQDALVSHECECNVAELIFISRRRLCGCASPETRAAWKLVIDAIREIDPIIADNCVPECIYRGFCPEFKSCGYNRTMDRTNKMTKYRYN